MVEQIKTPEPDKKEYPDENWSTRYIVIGVIACIGGLMLHLVIGSLYQWGMINIYVTSYYKTIDPSVTLESNAIAFPLMMFCIGLTMRLGIFYADHTHPLVALITCTITFSASIFISSYMTHIWGFFFFYGILFGLLVGLVFMLPVVQCNKYFPGKKMYVNGCILAGTGLGSIVFGLFSYNYLNPQKLHPMEGYYLGSPELQQLASKVPVLLRFLALLYFCISALGIALLSPVILHNKRKQNEELQKQKLKEEQNKKNETIQPHHHHHHAHHPQKHVHEAQTLKEAFCSKICWIEVLLVILVGCGLYLLNGNYKTYVKKTINDDEFLTIVGVVGSVGNGCSRFLWNVLFLKTGYKFVMLCIIALQLIVLSVIRFTVYTQGAYIVLIFIANSCLGGLLVTTPTVAQVIFGQKTGSNIYGFYWCSIATANFIQYFYVSNLSKTIGFDNIIYICLGMAVCAIPIVLFTKFQGPWMNETIALEYCITCQSSQVQPQENDQLAQKKKTEVQLEIERKAEINHVREIFSQQQDLSSSSISSSNALQQKQPSQLAQLVQAKNKKIKLLPIQTPIKRSAIQEQNQETAIKTDLNESSNKFFDENNRNINSTEEILDDSPTKMTLMTKQ